MVGFGLKALLTLHLLIKTIFTAETNCRILAEKFNVMIKLADGSEVIESSTFRTQISIKERRYTVTLDFRYPGLYIPPDVDAVNAQSAMTDTLIYTDSSTNTDMTRKVENKPSTSHLHGNNAKCITTHTKNYGALSAAIPTDGNKPTSPHHAPHPGLMEESTARIAGESAHVPHGVKAENADSNGCVNQPERSISPVKLLGHESNDLPNDASDDVPGQPVQYVTSTHVRIPGEVIDSIRSVPMLSPLTQSWSFEGYDSFDGAEHFAQATKPDIDENRPAKKRRKTQQSEVKKSNHEIKSDTASTRKVQILIEGNSYTLSQSLLSSTCPKELDLTQTSDENLGAILGLGVTKKSFVNTVLGDSPMYYSYMSLFIAQKIMNVEIKRERKSRRVFTIVARSNKDYSLLLPSRRISYGNIKIESLKIDLNYQTPYIWLPRGVFELFLQEVKRSSQMQLSSSSMDKARNLTLPFPCDAQSLEKFPVFTFFFENATIYLNAKNYTKQVLDRDEGLCSIQVGSDAGLTHVRVGYILLQTYSLSIRYDNMLSVDERRLQLAFERLQ